MRSTGRIELDCNEDGTDEELIAAAAPAISATKASFVRMVTGPPSVTVRLRVSLPDTAVSDTSNVTFQIRP